MHLPFEIPYLIFKWEWGGGGEEVEGTRDSYISRYSDVKYKRNIVHYMMVPTFNEDCLAQSKSTCELVNNKNYHKITNNKILSNFCNIVQALFYN